MKRRTDKTGTLNGEKHRRAFDHAYQVLSSVIATRVYQTAKTHHRGLRIRFWIELEREDGKGVIPIKFDRCRGFRMDVQKVKFTGTKPESHRLMELRLRIYRSQLLAWQQQTHTLTFRHFNLLLAALSYDVAANP